MTNFIEVYENALDAPTCLEIITKFESSDKITQGRTGHGVDITKKDSQELNITGFYEWMEIENRVLNTTFGYLKQYFRKYLFTLLGAISPELFDPANNQTIVLTPDNFDQFVEIYMDDLIQYIYRRDSLIVEKYPQVTGGYHRWHSEIYPDPNSAKEETLHRVLFFQYYLNTVKTGGETEFFYQKLKIKPEQGKLAIAPAGFTHTYKNHIPLTEDQYILTSYILFETADKIYEQISRI